MTNMTIEAMFINWLKHTSTPTLFLIMGNLVSYRVDIESDVIRKIYVDVPGQATLGAEPSKFNMKMNRQTPLNHVS